MLLPINFYLYFLELETAIGTKWSDRIPVHFSKAMLSAPFSDEAIHIIWLIASYLNRMQRQTPKESSKLKKNRRLSLRLCG